MLKILKILLSKFPLRLKMLIFDILNISLIKNKIKNFNKTIFGVPYNFTLIDEDLRSLIYFGVWESAEISLAIKYLKHESMIIECGASLGVVASNILFRYQEIQYYAIEGNPNSYEILSKQVLNKGFVPINAVINYPDGMVEFNCSSVLGASVEGIKNNKERLNNISLWGQSLTKILRQNNVAYINASYSLILDVEGLEGLIFRNDPDIVSNANYIICELEDTLLYTIQDQVKMLENIKFKKIENIDNVYAFIRLSNDKNKKRVSHE